LLWAIAFKLLQGIIHNFSSNLFSNLQLVEGNGLPLLSLLREASGKHAALPDGIRPSPLQCLGQLRLVPLGLGLARPAAP